MLQPDELYPAHTRREKQARQKAVSRSRRLSWLQCLTAALAVSIGLGVGSYQGWQFSRQAFLPSVPALAAGGSSSPSPLRLTAEAATFAEALEHEAGYAGASKAPQLAPTPAGAAQRLVINIPSRSLTWYQGNRVQKRYPVAVGKPSTPTPIGVFAINSMERNPWWYPPQKQKPPVPSGPANPLGYRWMGFAPLYGVHGTNTPWQIGGAVSNGCVRMFEADVEELFDVIQPGATVQITYDVLEVAQTAGGEVSVGVYPDVYGYRRGSTTPPQLLARLQALGLEGFVDLPAAAALLEAAQRQPIPCALVQPVVVRGQLLAQPMISYQGRRYAPIGELAKRLGLSWHWDAVTGLLYIDGHTVPAVDRAGRLYAEAEAVQGLLGGLWLWNQLEQGWRWQEARLQFGQGSPR